MKVFTVVLILIIFSSCQESDNDRILGRWKVSTRAFDAVYQIENDENGYSCRVYSYNDGTTKYTSQSKNKPYIFKNIQIEEELAADGSTGATNSKKISSSTHIIHIINEDQIEVISTVMNQKKTEIWTRTH